MEKAKTPSGACGNVAIRVFCGFPRMGHFHQGLFTSRVVTPTDFAEDLKNRNIHALAAGFQHTSNDRALRPYPLLAFVFLLRLCFPINAYCQAGNAEVLLRQLHSDNPAVSSRAAAELADMCNPESPDPAVRKITRGLESALAGKACPYGGAEWCEMVRQSAYALARCSGATGELSPRLFDELKNPAHAGVSSEIECSIAEVLVSSIAKTGRHDIVRQVIDAFKSDPQHVREVPVIFAAALIQVLNQLEAGNNSPIADRVDQHLIALTNPNYYPNKNEQDPLLVKVKIALASTIAEKLRDRTMSGPLAKALCPDCSNNNGQLTNALKKLVEVPACELNLIEALTERIGAGGGTKAEADLNAESGLLMALLTMEESKGDQKAKAPEMLFVITPAEATAKRRAAFIALLSSKNMQPKDRLDNFRGRVLKALSKPAPGDDQFEIIRNAVQRTLTQGDTALCLYIWNAAGQREGDVGAVWKEGIQRGFADALMHGNLNETRAKEVINFLGTKTDMVLNQGTGRNDLFGQLVSFIYSGPGELKRAALSTLVQLKAGLPPEPDFHRGLDQYMLDGLIAATGDAALAWNQDFRQLGNNTLQRIQTSKAVPKVPGDKAWILTDLLLTAWKRQYDLWSKQHDLRSALLLLVLDSDCNGWLSTLNPQARTDRVQGLEAWQLWWRTNKYTFQKSCEALGGA